MIAQWKTWFNQLRDAGIVMFLFVHDDGTPPFDNAGLLSSQMLEPNVQFSMLNVQWVISLTFNH